MGGEKGFGEYGQRLSKIYDSLWNKKPDGAIILRVADGAVQHWNVLREKSKGLYR